jgi:hypothetical protein
MKASFEMYPRCRQLRCISRLFCVRLFNTTTSAFVVRYHCKSDAKSWVGGSYARCEESCLAESAISPTFSLSTPATKPHRNFSTNRRSGGAPLKSKNKNSPVASHKALNKALVQADSATAVLELLQHSATLNQNAAGSSLDAVNFATAWNRLARHSANSLSSVRTQVLQDPRTALLLACTAEALATKPQQFQSQGLANLAWALAKLKAAPPQSEQSNLVQLPAARPTLNLAQANNHSHVEIQSRKALLDTATTVRQIVTEVEREHSQRGSGEQCMPRWIPALSKLAAHLLDAVGEVVWHQSCMHSHASSANTPLVETQNWSNLLWAWSTAGRANEAVFGVAIRCMITQHRAELRVTTNEPSAVLKPQNWSNAIWAVATAQCCDGHEDLLVYVAQLLDEHPHFVSEFNSQELSNTVWGVATLISNSKKPGSGGGETVLSEREQQAALIIVRHCLRTVVKRQAAGFDTQALSNTAWAAATLGFGLTHTSSSSTDASINNYVILPSVESTDAQLMVAAIQTIGVAALSLLARFSPQELSNLAWALARLLGDASNTSVVAAMDTESSWPDTSRSLLVGIGRQLADPTCAVEPQDVAMTLRALATLKIDDESIYRSIAQRMTIGEANRCEPQALSNSVWALATAEVTVEEIDVFDTSLVPGLQKPAWPRKDPAAMCFALAAQELMKRPQQFSSQQIKDALWSFSTASIRHPFLFRSVAEHVICGPKA